jgi:hypothetical protein
MVFSNAENKRGGANETTRSPLLGARIWPDGRATSSSARTLFCESYGPRHRSRKACILWVTNQGRGGVQEYSTAQKSYAAADFEN